MKEGTFQSQKQMLLNKKYWIPNIRDKIQKIIGNCVPCICLAGEKQGRREEFLNFKGIPRRRCVLQIRVAIRHENHEYGRNVKYSEETINCFRESMSYNLG